MTRLNQAFERAAAEGRSALVVFLSAGDPSLDATVDLVLAAADAGADIVELGVPYSDPTADGAAIQRASARAIKNGTTLKGVLEAVRKIRTKSEIPLVQFGYYNPILRYGEERLVRDAKVAGVDGLLVVDLPPEECASLRDPAIREGLDFIPLVAPTSDEARLKLAASVATSFVYSVSMTGVTGSAGLDLEAAGNRSIALSKILGKPIALGFGIRTPEQVRAIAGKAEGIVVGSAIVETIEAASSPEEAVERVHALIRALSEATRT
ncbi:MAG: tryptophan synthase subunit alpha [Sandaracinaceae bacterium]|nr:tryptophan synthase subunit alpha [Sandaracinaceae bacterium]